ncbi:MAG TPA: NADH-quinone oxidoreductase subunit NuoF [Anaerolineales bacterium]|nr:NADH-quinone oxidoreductase subunit NuoF [Anaerolineales bacterium]
MASEHILLRHRDVAGLERLDVYLEHGGFAALRAAVTTKSPAEVIDLVKASGLRGRGGAGFPTGVKWSFLSPNVFPRYVVVNADESEPGTFKDREILERNPFQFLEGVAICAYAAQAASAYIYCRGEFWDLAEGLERRIAELKERRLLGANLFGSDFSLEIFVHLGAGAYICGEETALLESLEGKLGQPRLRPPFPAAKGLYARPTVVNNVETLTNLPPIVERGAEWYRSIGTKDSPGTKVFSLSGHVARPGNYELPLGTTFRSLIFDHGGGVPGGRTIKAILPAGASAPMLRATDEVLDTPMDYESLPKAGSMLGSASIIVMDESVDVAWVALKTTRFFKHESCGKCTPCREGTYWMLQALERLHNEGAPGQVDLLVAVARGIEGKCLCPLGEFSIMPVTSGVDRFRPDFSAHEANGR